jgi:hypothetical protein
MCREAHERRIDREVETLARVPVEPFRERFLLLQKQGLTRGDVARAMGWVHRRNPDDLARRGCRPDRVAYKADTTRVARVLGLTAQSRGGYLVADPCITRAIPYDVAVRLAQILGLDPVDAGL